MRLIDADVLKKQKTILWDEAIGFCDCVVVEDIDNAPTVDAVEVVRCKDCKHWADGVSGCTDHVKCCKIGYYMVGENGYCVYGERKTDER